MEVSKYIVGYSIVELTTTMCYLGLLQPRVYEATKGDEKARNNSTYTVYGKVQNHKQNIWRLKTKWSCSRLRKAGLRNVKCFPVAQLSKHVCSIFFYLERFPGYLQI